MNTQEALDILITDFQNEGVEIDRLNKRHEAKDVAIKQLQGILDTPSEDMVVAQSTISELQSVKSVLETEIEEKAEVIRLKDVEIEDLKNPVKDEEPIVETPKEVVDPIGEVSETP